MIYTRGKSYPQIVADLKDNITSLKSRQYVGNDSFVVREYSWVLPGPITVTSSGKKFKTTFTFDQPSNSYVDITMRWEAAGSFLYNEYDYYDPATIESRTEQAAILHIVPTTTITVDVVVAVVKSTQSGTILLEQL